MNNSTLPAIINHEVGSEIVPQRIKDGYVNATSMHGNFMDYYGCVTDNTEDRILSR